MPPSSSAICSLFTKLKVMDASTTEELAFNVGFGEVLEMLVCSLVSKTPLSETLLKLKSQPNLSNEYPNQGICIEPQTVGGCMNEEDTISVKLIVCKSQKIVCYAEAGEDFVNLVFSFLTVPLGFIIKQIQDRSSSLKGSIEQLYKSVQDLDDEFFKSNYQKEILLNPKLYPGFCYENRLLGIEYGLETSNYYARYWTGDSFSKVVTTDKDFVPSYSSYRPSVTTVPLKLKYCETLNDPVRDQGFLNGPTMFTITDNLIIRPISPLFGLSVLNKMKVPFTDIEEQIVQVGKEEAFRLLVTSFLSDSSLTSVFLRQPKSKFEQ
ncbi:uncharacterized protein LOC112169505 isoform X1 [Rosa chinensis]|nr:uncharacterized protein LOC112169505 isoform X1 [Rosa chinensis]XP_040363981.1 uncharacterized protein LOC112169505 isoform X1 [Rosa chinensis]